MHNLPLLLNISVALAVAFVGGLLARRAGLPAIVGYLFAGIAIGPFTPGFVGDSETISQLAELGVIFLMFGVGLHFSLADLWQVRKIAVPGAIGRMALTTLLGFGLSQLLGWSITEGLTIGLSISIASTVVLLRGLMDNNLLNTPHGRVAVGWVVVEDIASVLILILMPTLSLQRAASPWLSVGFTLLKASAFVLLMILVGKRFIPWLLDRIARTRSRELFIIAILVITLATALGAAEIFAVSLALGAFVAGAIVGESPLSHQVGADVLPFREAFAVLFFVSVGMLVNPAFLLANLWQVFALTGIVVIGKSLISLLLGFILKGQAMTFLVVALSLSHIGEFTFILGQAGLSLGLIDRNQYSLILATAVLSIMVNPWLVKQVPKLEGMLRRMPVLWRRLDRHSTSQYKIEPPQSPPVVIVGYGRVGGHLVAVLRSLEIPIIVVEADVEKVEILNKQQVPTIYGDAANSEVLLHAGLDNAKALVVTVPEEASSELIVGTAHQENPNLPIVARAATEEGIRRLSERGANFVIHPELEGGLEMIRHTLLELGFPLQKVDGYAADIRALHYEFPGAEDRTQPLLRNILQAIGEIELSWFEVVEGTPFIGRTLAESRLREQTGASVVALVRAGQLFANPKSSISFQSGDRLAVIGEPDQIRSLENLLQPDPR